MSAPHPLPEALAQALAAYDRRRRRVLWWRGMGEATLVGGLALAGVAAIDRFVHPGFGSRVALSAAGLSTTLTVLATRGLLPATRRRPTVELARAVERAAGGLQERLSAAVQFAAGPTVGVSAWMVNRTIALAANEAAALDARALVDARPARRLVVPALSLLTALAGGCLISGVPSLYARALWPWAPIARPASTRLTVDPGDRQVALGAAMTIGAAATPDADAAEIDIEWQDGVRETAAMERVGTRWRWQVGAVTRPFAYVVRAGDAESQRYRVSVVAPPRVERLRLRVTPPAYSGRPGREIEGGDAEIVAGSVVALLADLAGDAVASAAVVPAEGDEQAAFVEPAQGGEPAHARAELRPTADFTYGLKLVGASGFASESTQRWLIKVAPDAPPTVALTAPGIAGGLVAPDEAVPVTVDARDDLGLKRVELEIARDGETSTRSLAPPPGATATIAAAIDLRDWDAAPGDAFTVTAIVTDVGGQSARSTPLALTVAGAADGAAAAEAARLRALLAVIATQSESLAAQGRTWTTLARTADSDDAVTRRGGLALIEDRAAAWETTLVAAIDAAIGDGRGDEDFLHLARELRCWTRAEAEQARVSAHEAEREPKLLADGGAVAEAALQDLAAFRHDLKAFAARCEGVALAGRSDALAARAARAAAIVRADRGWTRGGWHPGLAATFFRGLELQGDAVTREVGLPLIENRQVAGIGGENYSVRWEGELSVPAAGDWTIQATADDGVRVAVNGQDLLGPQAWVLQPPTPYTATVHLEAGWHPLRVEFMQGGGGSVLKLAMGPAGGALAPLTEDRLRSRGIAVDPAAVQAMARLDPAAVQGAEGRFAHALIDLAGAAHDLGAFAEAVPTDALKRLAQEGAAAGEAGAAIAARLGHWSDADLDSGESGAAALATSVRAARDQLVEAVREVATRRPPLGAFAELREALRRSHDRLERIQHLPGELPEADRRQAATRAMAAARSWFEQMRRDTPRARAALLDSAQGRGADARTAVAATRASRTLGAVAQLLRETVARIAKIQDPYRETGEVLQYWQRLDELLREGLQREAEAHRLARADASRAALESLHASHQAEAEGHPAEAASRAREVRDQVRRLADAERAEGKDASAAELERLAGAPGSSPDPTGQLEAKLHQFDGQDHAWPADATAETAAALTASAQRLAQAPSEDRTAARDEARLDAREAAVATAAEAERRREAEPTRAQADGFAALAADLDAFAATGDEAKDLAALADRATALTGAKGPEAQQAAAQAKPPPAATAEGLEKLAAAANDAATHAERRAEVQDQVRALAGPEAKADAAASARAVAEAMARLDAAAAAETDARRRFAEAEASAAAAADELGALAAREAQTARDPADRAALAAAAEPAAKAAAAARDLAARSADQSVGTDQLAAAARAQADAVADGIARPLAEASRVGDPNDAEDIARAGRQAATTAALERHAADEVERAERRRAEARRDLAGAVLAAGVPDATDTTAATGAQAAAAQHQADAAAAEAAQRWRDAAAQAKRAAGNPGDAGAVQQAAQARQAALDSQARALQQFAAADQSRAAVATALAGPNANQPALAAAQAQQATAAEEAALGLADRADAVDPAAAAAARASAAPAAAAGRATEATLRSVAAGMAAGGAPATAPGPASSPHTPAAAAARSAMAGIEAAPGKADAYRTAARVLADAAQAERLAAATPHWTSAAPQQRSDSANGQQGEGSATETHAGQGDAGSAAGLATNPGGPDQADWARLPEAERRARAEGVERFSEEHQEAIRAYLRRLGEEK